MAADRQRPKLAEVARRAGVSISTASRVVSDNGYPVADATRRRVVQAVRELNYSPSALARALATRRTRIVGVLVGDVEDPYFSEIVRGVEDVARRSGYLVIVCNTDRDSKTELEYLRTLRSYRLDGVIFAGGGLDTREHSRGLKRAVAHLRADGSVVIALARVPAPVPTLTIDHRGGARAMTEYLLSLGHRRIAVIAGPTHLTTAQDRLAGIREALGTGGLPDDMVVQGAFTYAGGEEAATALLGRPEPPTAIFAVNDLMAVGALDAVRARGLAVPGEVTVVGFGDIAPSRRALPPLTTIGVPRHELGARGMEALLGELNEGRPAESGLLDYSLQIRGSSGPPRPPGSDRAG